MNDYIEVSTQHHCDGEVPAFFQEIWEKQKGQNPLENEKQYDKQYSKGIWFIIAGICGIAILMALAILRFEPISYVRGPVLNFDPRWLWVPAIASAVMFIVWWLVSPSALDNPDKWHWKAYCDSVEQLFNLFGIKPGPEVGKMSRELFQQYIVESLKVQAKIVDCKRGFERPAAMDLFKEKHKAALEWGLCEEKYDSYFPKKAEMQK